MDPIPPSRMRTRDPPSPRMIGRLAPRPKSLALIPGSRASVSPMVRACLRLGLLAAEDLDRLGDVTRFGLQGGGGDRDRLQDQRFFVQCLWLFFRARRKRSGGDERQAEI